MVLLTGVSLDPANPKARGFASRNSHTGRETVRREKSHKDKVHGSSDRSGEGDLLPASEPPWAPLGCLQKRAAFGADSNAAWYVPNYWVLCHPLGAL